MITLLFMRNGGRSVIGSVIGRSLSGVFATLRRFVYILDGVGMSITPPPIVTKSGMMGCHLEFTRLSDDSTDSLIGGDDISLYLNSSSNGNTLVFAYRDVSDTVRYKSTGITYGLGESGTASIELNVTAGTIKINTDKGYFQNQITSGQEFKSVNINCFGSGKGDCPVISPFHGTINGIRPYDSTSIQGGDFFQGNAVDRRATINCLVDIGDVIDLDYYHAENANQHLLGTELYNGPTYITSEGLFNFNSSFAGSLTIDDKPVTPGSFTFSIGRSYKIRFVVAAATTITELLSDNSTIAFLGGIIANFTVTKANGDTYRYLANGSVEDQGDGTAIARNTGNTAPSYDAFIPVFNPTEDLVELPFIDQHLIGGKRVSYYRDKLTPDSPNLWTHGDGAFNESGTLEIIWGVTTGAGVEAGRTYRLDCDGLSVDTQVEWVVNNEGLILSSSTVFPVFITADSGPGQMLIRTSVSGAVGSMSNISVVETKSAQIDNYNPSGWSEQ